MNLNMIVQFECWCLVMMIPPLNWHLVQAEVALNISDATPTSATSTSTSSESEENKDVETSTASQELTTENLPEIEPLNKYRRNGLDAEYLNKWEDDKKRYLLDLGYQFEDDYYPYKERARFNDKIFPVRVQGCPHYSRDVSRDDSVLRSGILQGWLGAAKGTGGGGGGGGTRNDDDKRLEMSPFYVTTATPKTASSYRNHANSNKPYADYENNYDKQSSNYGQSKPKYSTNYGAKGSASKDYYNFQGGKYADDRNVNSWQFPQNSKNNRVVYYEYNLDDNRRPESGYYPLNDPYVNNYNTQCDVEYEENSRRPTKNNYFNGNRYQQANYGAIVPLSRFSTNTNQEVNDREYGSYNSDDGYQHRSAERANQRSAGYDFNSPFPSAVNDKPNFPPPIPSTLTSPRTQFMAESGSVVRDKNAVKSIPYYTGHRFHFQPTNI